MKTPQTLPARAMTLRLIFRAVAPRITRKEGKRGSPRLRRYWPIWLRKADYGARSPHTCKHIRTCAKLPEGPAAAVPVYRAEKTRPNLHDRAKTPVAGREE